MCLMNIIKSHKNAGFHPLSRKHIFGKTTGDGGRGGRGGGRHDPQPFKG